MPTFRRPRVSSRYADGGGTLSNTAFAQFGPYMIPEDFGQKDYRYREEIEPAEWKSDVMRLCKAAQISCTEEQIKADFPKQK